MKKNRVTIYDIAKEANVSVATVSRVINNSGPVKKEKKEEILRIMQKYNYTPNMLARSLITNQTKLIGVILPDIINPFFNQLCIEVEKNAHRHGYNVILCNSFSNYDLESVYIRSLLEKQVDAIVFMAGRITNYKLKKKYLEELILAKERTYIVTINGIYQDVCNCNIVTDEKKGLEELMQLISKKGYSKVGFIFGEKDISATEDKKRWFLEYAEMFNLKTRKEWLIEAGFTFEAGKKGADYITSQAEIPEVILCVNDIVAVGALKKLQEKKFKVPEDIKITGFDDIEIGKYLSPSLTTVNQNYEQIGEKVIEEIIKKDSKTKTILIPTKLVERESC